MARIVDLLAEAINPKEDDLRAYPLLTGVPQRHYGRGRLPDGVLIEGQTSFFNS